MHWKTAALLMVLSGAIAQSTLAQAPKLAPGNKERPKAEPSPKPPDWMPLEGFTKMPLEEALQESIRTHKFLIVVCYEAPSQWGRSQIFDNPSLRAWIKWHAIAVNETDPKVCEQLRHQGAKVTRRDGSNPRDPLLFKDGKAWRLFGSDFGQGAINFNGEEYDRTCHTAACLLLRLDLTLEACRSRDPIWAAIHDAQNPPPPPPPMPDPLYQTDDGLAPVISDPKEIDGGPPDVLARLFEARRAVKAGDLHTATGLYTWLWERAEAADPAMIGIRLTTIADEMCGLATRRGGAKERFAKLQGIQTDRALWLDYAGLDEWFILNGVVGDESPTVTFLDSSINDPDEGSMIPPEDLGAFRAIAKRPGVGLPARFEKSSAVENSKKRISTMREIMKRPRRPNVPDEMWEEHRRVLQRLIVSESCRLFAGLLVAGDEPGAQAAAKLALDEFNDPNTRRALTAAALAARQPRPFMTQWLDEADAAAGPKGKNPALRRQLEALLAGRELDQEPGK